MITQEELKKLIAPFIVIFLINFLIINWNSVSWVFNYRIVSQTLSQILPKRNLASSSFDFEEEKDLLSILESSDKENSLEISKLNIIAPLVIVENSDEEDLEKRLDEGVVLFPDSVLPGKVGQTIILGHSAPSNWPKINYDWVFADLDNLEKGDEIIIHFNHLKYPYFVTGKIFLERGEEIPEQDLTNLKNNVMLISCWPPGKDLQRIAIEAELVI